MELVYDLWHLAFANLMEERAPSCFEVQSEVRLTIEPQRADMLLLRRRGVERCDEQARILVGIWPRLAKVTLVEFKSPTRSSYRRGDLLRLWGYGPLYQTSHLDELPRASDLTLLLILPSLTPTLLEDIEAMGFALDDLGQGYRRIVGMVYDAYVATTDDVATAEHDAFLQLFSRRPSLDRTARWWLRHWMAESKMKQNIEDIPGYDEMWQKILDEAPVEARLAGLSPEQRLAGLPPEQRLAGLPPEQRLAGLRPEQRLAGLSPEQQLLALPNEILRQLPESYLSTLSPEVREIIRRRLGGGSRSD